MHVELLHDGTPAFLLPAALLCPRLHLCGCHSGTLALLLLLCLCFTVTGCPRVSLRAREGSLLVFGFFSVPFKPIFIILKWSEIGCHLVLICIKKLGKLLVSEISGSP